jgi:hypothetical protein
VFSCIREKDGASFAVKKIEWGKQKKKREELFNKELEVLKKLPRHLNIACLVG